MTASHLRGHSPGVPGATPGSPTKVVVDVDAEDLVALLLKAESNPIGNLRTALERKLA